MEIAQRPNGQLRELPGWHVLLLFGAALLALFSRFLRPHPLGLFEDDFFYYVQVARNLTLHHISSFDGTHLTNGYHPLWFVVIAVLFRFFPGMTFFLAVQAVSLILLFVFYWNASSIFRRFGLSSQSSALAALLLSLHALLLFRYGMEVTLALPLSMAAIAFALTSSMRWSASQTFLLGLLASCAVLARLDISLLIALLTGSMLLQVKAPWFARLRALGCFSAGFAPFFLYLLLNLHWFHVLLPVSGSAKQMKPLFPPSWTPARSVLLPLDHLKLAFVLPALVLLLLAVTRLVRLWASLSRAERVLYPPLLLFPFVHIAVLSLLSDWSVWAWYFYSLSFSSLAGLALLLRPSPLQRSAAFKRLICVGFCAGYVVYLAVYSFERKPAPIFFLATDIAGFTHEHPGVYAMGDGAGSTAFLSDQPFVQLEGLTMDASYLKLMRRSTPLPQVLASLQARYYVVLTASPPSYCLVRAEPAQAGPHSPHMQGRLCAFPLAEFNNAGFYASIYNAADVQ